MQCSEHCKIGNANFRSAESERFVNLEHLMHPVKKSKFSPPPSPSKKRLKYTSCKEKIEKLKQFDPPQPQQTFRSKCIRSIEQWKYQRIFEAKNRNCHSKKTFTGTKNDCNHNKIVCWYNIAQISRTDAAQFIGIPKERYSFRGNKDSSREMTRNRWNQTNVRVLLAASTLLEPDWCGW